MVVPIVFSQEMNRYGIHIHLSEYYSGEAYVRIKLMKVPIKWWIIRYEFSGSFGYWRKSLPGMELLPNFWKWMLNQCLKAYKCFWLSINRIDTLYFLYIPNKLYSIFIFWSSWFASFKIYYISILVQHELSKVT